MDTRIKKTDRSSLCRLFALIAVCFTAITINAATPWKFTRTYSYKDWNNAQIESENVTLTGGTLDLVVTGTPYDLCPRGNERMRFTWRFDKDISQFNPGDRFGARLEAQLVSMGGDCKGGLAYRTNANVIGGVSSINWDKIVGVRGDGDRFLTKSYERASPSPTWQNYESTVIEINDIEPYPERKYGGFIVHVSGPGGELAYLYAYEPVGAGGGNTKPPTAGGGNSTGGNPNACGFTLGPDIYNKWQQLGGESGLLGCAVMNEAEAGRSPRGTTGRYVKFGSPSGGSVIHWHRTGKYAGQAFETHGCIYQLFSNLGGSVSWLGFPISDEYSVSGGRRSDFEGGYIFWDAKTSKCQALNYYDLDKNEIKHRRK